MKSDTPWDANFYGLIKEASWMPPTNDSQPSGHWNIKILVFCRCVNATGSWRSFVSRILLRNKRPRLKNIAAKREVSRCRYELLSLTSALASRRHHLGPRMFPKCSLILTVKSGRKDAQEEHFESLALFFFGTIIRRGVHDNDRR